MIDPKQLRLGNYLILNGKVGRAISITEGSIQIGTTPSDDICIAVMNNNDCPTKKREDPTYISNTVSISSYRYITPVLITGEILQKCGFFCQIFDVYSLPPLEFSPKNGWWLYDQPTSIRIEYLHKLQNLYFSLTGKELKINL